MIGTCVSLYLVAYFVFPPDRSYTLVAVSKGVAIEFHEGGLSDWRLAEARICRPLPRRPRVEGPLAPPKECDERRYAATPVTGAEIGWPDGAAVSVVHGGDDFVRIAVRRAETPIPVVQGESVSAGDVIVVPDEAFDRSGVLPFFGCVQIGLELYAGTNSELLSGHYEVRERLFPRRGARAIDEGDLLPGDSLSFQHSTAVDGKDCLPTGGFLGSTGEADAAGMRVVAYAPLGKPFLRVDRRGLEPAFLVPDWMDRAAKDPWLIGFAALLTFLATLKALCLDGSWRLRPAAAPASLPPATAGEAKSARPRNDVAGPAGDLPDVERSQTSLPADQSFSSAAGGGGGGAASTALAPSFKAR